MPGLEIPLPGWAIVAAIAAISGLFGALLNTRAMVARVQKALDEHRVEVARSYATLAHLDAFEKRLSARLDRLEEKIDGSRVQK